MIDEKYTQPQYWLGLNEVGALETGLADFAAVMIALSEAAPEQFETFNGLYVAWDEVETVGTMHYLRKKDKIETSPVDTGAYTEGLPEAD